MNRSAQIVLFIGVVLVILLLMPWEKTPELDLDFKKAGILKIEDINGAPVVNFDYELADTEEKREQGLMYRKELKENQGMLFIMEEEEVHSFWMLDTYIPLDIIFINTDKEVVFIAKSLEPEDQEPVNSKTPCLYALEVNAGIAEKHNIKVGDLVSW